MWIVRNLTQLTPYNISFKILYFELVILFKFRCEFITIIAMKLSLRPAAYIS